jgi:hypothetical protein
MKKFKKMNKFGGQGANANKISHTTIRFHHDPGSLLCRFPGHGEDGTLGRPSGRISNRNGVTLMFYQLQINENGLRP